jgi:hypothetical protein
MTVRVVPLGSPEASQVPVVGTMAERVGLVRRLSAMLWAATGRPLPSYTRATMPIMFRGLRDPAAGPEQ